ncbi:MAG: choice-of-anchor C family protein [Burkholderiaceae bacterium]
MKAFNKRMALLVLGAALGVAAQAAPFQNGSFETGPTAGVYTTLAAGDTQITGWIVTGNDIDYIGTYWTAADGSRSLDLSGGSDGGIQQAFDTQAGHVYRVSFSLAGNPAGEPTSKTVQVQATGGALTNYTFDVTGHSLASMGWATRTYTFTATGSTSTLSFTSLDDTAYGPALDNVVVTDVTPAPVPTTSAWGLLTLASLLGFAAWRGRRRSH